MSNDATLRGALERIGTVADYENRDNTIFVMRQIARAALAALPKQEGK